MFEVRRPERLESNSGIEKHEDLLPFPSPALDIEPNSDLEKHEDLLPFPLASLRYRAELGS
jgi:hypothetical protein